MSAHATATPARVRASDAPAPDPAKDRERLAFASALDRLALDAYADGRFKDACAQFLGALAIREEVLGAASVAVADGFNNVGVTLRKLGQLQRARMHHERALEIRKLVQGGDHPQIATTLSNLGNVLICQGEVDLAAEHYERAEEIRSRAGLAESSGAIRLATNVDVVRRLRRAEAVSADPRARVEVSGEIRSAPRTTPATGPLRGAPVLPKPGRLSAPPLEPLTTIETQPTSQIALNPSAAPAKVIKQRTMQLDLDSELVEEVDQPGPPPPPASNAGPPPVANAKLPPPVAGAKLPPPLRKPSQVPTEKVAVVEAIASVALEGPGLGEGDEVFGISGVGVAPAKVPWGWIAFGGVAVVGTLVALALLV